MTQGKHTPGAMGRTSQSSGELHINGRYIARVISGPTDADRICAAWNACEGIPTEALEAGVVRDMLDRARALVENLDEGDFISATRIDALRAIIAKATGESQ